MLLRTGWFSKLFHQELADLGCQFGSHLSVRVLHKFSFIISNPHGVRWLVRTPQKAASTCYFIVWVYFKHLLHWKRIKGDDKAELELTERL